MIGDLVARDAAYYSPQISRNTVANLNRFCRDLGVISSEPAYEQVVATGFAHLWNA